MAIDLRNIKPQSEKIKEIKESYLDKDIKLEKISHTDKNLDIAQTDIQKKSPNSLSQWVLIGYFAIFFIILITIYLNNWTSPWQLPKTLGLILGGTGALILSITLWIFGNIKHTVKITLLDILWLILGIAIVILSLINPNQITFWGNISRIFDSGIAILFLIIIYFIIRLFLEYKSLIVLSGIYAFIVFLGSLVSVVLVYLPLPANILTLGSKLAPSYSFLTESPQELLLLSLTGLSIWYVLIHIYRNSTWKNTFFKVLYLISSIIHILLLIRIPFLPIQILSILVLIVQGIVSIRDIRDTKQKSITSLQAIRLTFIYAIVIIGAIFLMIVKPFNPQYELLVNPDIRDSANIVKNTLQNSPILGAGSVLYAWAQYLPDSFLKTSLWDYSFDTLYNEYFNISVRYGIIPMIILGLIAIWISFSFIRILFIQRIFPPELFPIIILFVGSLLIPFTVVGKLGIIIGVILWLFTITKYFHPITKFSLDLTKSKPQIASLFTFIAITIIAGTLFLSTQAINIVRAQLYITKTIGNTNIGEVLQLAERARALAPQIIDYAQITIPLLTQQINQDILALISSQAKADDSQTKPIQDKINRVQGLLDDYKARFPRDERLIRWQLELYGVIQKYGDIDSKLLTDSVRAGSLLRPSSPYWNLYEAQYYIRQSQKSDPVNKDDIAKAKSLLDKSIEIKPDFALAYLTYFDVYGIDNNYSEQITILNKYVSTVTSQDVIADKDVVYSLAVAYQNNEQYSEAISIYTKLLDAFPQYTNVYFKLGELYEIQNEKQEAIKQYKKVLELDPEASVVQEKLNKLEKSK